MNIDDYKKAMRKDEEWAEKYYERLKRVMGIEWVRSDAAMKNVLTEVAAHRRIKKKYERDDLAKAARELIMLYDATEGSIVAESHVERLRKALDTYGE